MKFVDRYIDILNSDPPVVKTILLLRDGVLASIRIYTSYDKY